MVAARVTELFCDLIVGVFEEDVSASTPLIPEEGVELIDIVRLVMACERAFSITIHDEDVGSFRTLDDVIRYIEAALDV